MLMSRFHYTIDIIFGVFVAIIFWIFYHKLAYSEKLSKKFPIWAWWETESKSDKDLTPYNLYRAFMNCLPMLSKYCCPHTSQPMNLFIPSAQPQNPLSNIPQLSDMKNTSTSTQLTTPSSSPIEIVVEGSIQHEPLHSGPVPNDQTNSSSDEEEVERKQLLDNNVKRTSYSKGKESE